MTSGKRQGCQRANRRPKLSRIAQAVQFEALEGRQMLNGDTTLPVAVLTAPEVTAGGPTTHTFTIVYSDDVAMDPATVDGDEVRVTGPSSFNPVVSLKLKQTQADGSVLATYEFVPPGAKWDSTDNSAAGYSVEILQDKVKDAAGNSLLAGVLGAIVVNIESQAPTAAMKTSPLPAPTAGAQKYTFVVIYTDNVGLDTSTFGGADNDLTISKTGFTANATYVSHVAGTAANSYEVTYEFTAPGGTWDAADNGSYTITKVANGVKDVNGNSVSSGSLATLSANLTDVTPPTAMLDAPAFNATGNGTYQFTVLFNDDVGLNTATFGTGDVTVTRPGGYSQIASYVRFEVGTANERRVIYEVIPPGGTWNAADNGLYTVVLNSNEVRDTAGNAAAVAVLDTFTVAIPPVDSNVPTMTLLSQGYEPLGSTLSVTVRYDDAEGINSAYLPSTRILATGPGGRITVLSFLAADDGSNPRQRVVTYAGPAPGGIWDPSDNGTYTVTAESGVAAVDTGNNPVNSATTAGTFDVAVALDPVSVDASGNLLIYGTDAADTITLNIVNGMIRVAVGAATEDFIPPSIRSIRIIGLAGNDLIAIGPAIMGTSIDGGAGDDTLMGGDSADSLYGGAGNDSLSGGWGNDYLSGGEGNDSLDGGVDDDVLDGGFGGDVITGGLGIDTVDYSWRVEPLRIYIDGAANDGEKDEADNVQLDVENAVGGFGNDYIVGSPGANLLAGGRGNDTLVGGAGNDTLDGGLDGDALFGGAAEDTVTYASRTANVLVSLNNQAGDGQVGENDNVMNDVENIIGGSRNDLLVGSGFANKLWGGAGNDTLKGGAGNDTLDGGAGIDKLYGQTGHDRFYMADRRRDLAVGGPGADTAEIDSNDQRSEIEKLLKSKRTRR